MERDDQIRALEAIVQRGEMMAELQNDDRFIAIFQDHFIDAWAVTNTMNIASYDVEAKQRTFEKMNARSIFSQYCEELIQDGLEAKDALAELDEA